MIYLNTAFIKLTLFFAAGILAGFFINLNLTLLFCLFSANFVLFILFFVRAKKLFLQDISFGIATLFLFFFTGIITTHLHLPQNQPRHYTQHIAPKSNNDDSPVIKISIAEELKPDLYNRKFIAEVEQINNKFVHGKILLLVPANTINFKITPSHQIIFSSELQPIPAPLNPHQFNYQSFMNNRGVFQQANLNTGSFVVLSSDNRSIKSWAANRRKQIVEQLQLNGFEQEELSIIQALLLGQRQDISEEIYNSYAAAGVIHILAVSGLHVGIILFLLHCLFAPLEKFKNGRFVKAFLLIAILWLFAVLAGLSPSVVRAVTMFSFVAIGLQLKRKTSVISTLFMSIMVLLIVRPQFLFEVGFQLSYLAVFSIVLLQPPLNNLFKPTNIVAKYLWGILSVTIAAQVGVLPLSLFYFHQFPGLFFLSNLVILPFMGIILALGIIVMLLALADLLPEFLTHTYNLLIGYLNDFVRFVAEQEGFLFKDISFSGYQAIGFYILLAALFLLLQKISYKRVVVILTAILVLQLVFYLENIRSTSDDFIIFHKSRNTLIGKKTDRSFTLHHNLDETPENQNVIRNYLVGERIKNLELENLQNIYSMGSDWLFVVDSLAIYSVPELRADYILLINSPKLNLNRLLDIHQPKAIIADGSNYKSAIEHWKETCKKKNILFHFTGTDGAFIFKN